MDDDTKSLSEAELMAETHKLQEDLRRAATDAGIVQTDLALFLTVKATQMGGPPLAVDLRAFMRKLAEAHPYLRRTWPDIRQLLDESVVPRTLDVRFVGNRALIVGDSSERPHLPPSRSRAGHHRRERPVLALQGHEVDLVSNERNTYQAPCPRCNNALTADKLNAERYAAVATRENFRLGVNHCLLCELGLPRVPSNISEEFVHTAVGGDDRVICARRS
jgi:hypothetical protein